MPSIDDPYILFDAGIFIGALLLHDTRHAAAALVDGVTSVFTYDPDDWIAFEAHGLRIEGPTSTLKRLGRL